MLLLEPFYQAYSRNCCHHYASIASRRSDFTTGLSSTARHADAFDLAAALDRFDHWLRPAIRFAAGAFSLSKASAACPIHCCGM